jgi:hypothetical protein
MFLFDAGIQYWKQGARVAVSNIDFDLIFGVLTPLSTIFQLYHGDKF